MSPLMFIAPSDLPDYVPPFGPASVLGDLAGNVWVRTLTTVNGGSTYDVFDQSSTSVARVLLTPGRVIVGFGEGGTVYVAVSESGGVRLERARLK